MNSSRIVDSIIKKDIYKVRNYTDIDFVIDIGGNIGVFSLLAAVLWPNSTVITYEPDKQCVDSLSSNARGHGNWQWHNMALTDGKPVYSNNNSKAQVFTESTSNGYQVLGVSLTDIFKSAGIELPKHKVIIKIDCEGGEKYLLNNNESTKLLQGCIHIAMEIHFGHTRGRATSASTWPIELPSYEDYKRWIEKCFSDTHDILYYKSSRTRGYGHYILTKKIRFIDSIDTEIYSPSGTHLGDAWSVLSKCINVARTEQRRVKLSRYYIKRGKRKYVMLLDKILPLLEHSELIDLAQLDPTIPKIKWQHTWNIPIARTKIRWLPNYNKTVCYQFDGRTHRSKNLPSAEIEEDLIKFLQDTGYDTIRLGKHMSLKECIEAVAQCECFIGVESGMAYLAAGAGTPIFYIANGRPTNTWRLMHNKCFVVTRDTADFKQVFMSYSKNRSIFRKLAHNIALFEFNDRWPNRY